MPKLLGQLASGDPELKSSGRSKALATGTFAMRFLKVSNWQSGVRGAPDVETEAPDIITANHIGGGNDETGFR